MCIANYQMTHVFRSIAGFEKVLLEKNEVDDGKAKPVNQSDSR